MVTSSRTIKSLLAVASSVFLLGSLTARAGALHVSAASATSNNVYDLTFNPPTGGIPATPLGIMPLTPSSKSSVRSIVYLPNSQTGVLDLIAADYNGSSIVRYAAATGGSTAFWTWTATAPAAGPKSPDGLSVDSSGNLFVVRGDAGHPELWVFPRDPGKAIGVGFTTPLLIDDNSVNGHFGTATSTRLLETLVVPGATAAGLTPGDLLVLVSDGRVLRYLAADIKSFINDRVSKPVTRDCRHHQAVPDRANADRHGHVAGGQQHYRFYGQQPAGRDGWWFGAALPADADGPRNPQARVCHRSRAVARQDQDLYAPGRPGHRPLCGIRPAVAQQDLRVQRNPSSC